VIFASESDLFTEIPQGYRFILHPSRGWLKIKNPQRGITAKMPDVKEERPTSSSTRASQDTNTNNEVPSLTSLATLDLLHQQVNPISDIS
jgi:hypothetical protein